MQAYLTNSRKNSVQGTVKRPQQVRNGSPSLFKKVGSTDGMSQDQLVRAGVVLDSLDRDGRVVSNFSEDGYCVTRTATKLFEPEPMMSPKALTARAL